MSKKMLALALAVGLILSLFMSCATPDRPLTAAELLDLGEKYLLELNYEQALVQFLKVIEIEPMNPRGYTGAAEAYIGLGQLDKAEEILKQGLEVVASEDNETLTIMLEMLRKAEPEDVTPETEMDPEPESEPTPSTDTDVSEIVPNNGEIHILITDSSADENGVVVTYDLISRVKFSLEEFERIKSGETLRKFGRTFTLGTRVSWDGDTVEAVYSSIEGETYYIQKSWSGENVFLTFNDDCDCCILTVVLESEQRKTLTDETNVHLFIDPNVIEYGNYSWRGFDMMVVDNYSILAIIDWNKLPGWSEFFVDIENGIWTDMRQVYYP
jgi:hypothetical protein